MTGKASWLISLAETFGEQLTEARLRAYLMALQEVNDNEVQAAITQILKDPSVTRFPLPAQILHKIKPELTSDDNAREIASRIIGAISRFGWCNQQLAREYVGELGWHVVQMQGGWGHLCENMKPNMVPTLQAQFRELAKTLHTKAELGILDEPPKLPTKRGVGLESIAGKVV